MPLTLQLRARWRQEGVGDSLGFWVAAHLDFDMRGVLALGSSLWNDQRVERGAKRAKTHWGIRAHTVGTLNLTRDVPHGPSTVSSCASKRVAMAPPRVSAVSSSSASWPRGTATAMAGQVSAPCKTNSRSPSTYGSRPLKLSLRVPR